MSIGAESADSKHSTRSTRSDRMTEYETLTFEEVVEGTSAERFSEEGWNIHTLEWVDGGLRIGATERSDE